MIPYGETKERVQKILNLLYKVKDNYISREMDIVGDVDEIIYIFQKYIDTNIIYDNMSEDNIFFDEFNYYKHNSSHYDYIIKLLNDEIG